MQDKVENQDKDSNDEDESDDSSDDENQDGHTDTETRRKTHILASLSLALDLKTTNIKSYGQWNMCPQGSCLASFPLLI